MAAKVNQTFYYHARILRNGDRITRQGTIGAVTPQEAADIIVDMSKEVWQKPLVHLEIYEYVSDGGTDLVFTSTIGENHARAISPIKTDKKAANDDDDDADDYAYWQAAGYGSVYGADKDSTGQVWGPWKIGSHTYPDTFPILKLPDTEAI